MLEGPTRDRKRAVALDRAVLVLLGGCIRLAYPGNREYSVFPGAAGCLDYGTSL